MRPSPIIIAMTIALSCGPATASPATDPSQHGYAIYAQRDRQDQGFGDQRAELRMVLYGSGERRAQRVLTISERELKGQGNQTLIVFSAPADIADTALLTHENDTTDRDDDQWLYLPAYKRTKRITTSGRSGRFVGTEFSYEDLAGDQLDDFDYRFIRDESLDGRATHLIERIPTRSSSAYSRQLTWVDAVTKQLLKAKLYDRKGRHIKTLEASDWHQYQGRYWRPHRLRMTHIASGRWTEMTTSGYRLDSGLRARHFRAAALGR